MDLKNLKKVYFIGIGGIGMSAIARYLNMHGVQVSGYDRTPTPLTAELEQEGIAIHYEDNIDLIPKDAELIIYTPAIPKEHKEFNFYKNNNYELRKRSEVLHEITRNHYTVAVAGTHGKTTTSSMAAHIVKQSNKEGVAFLGGITVNYNSNFIEGKGEIAVVEADEYDRSFLRLDPNIAVVTAIDPDHLDIYGSKEELEKTYLEFIEKVNKQGHLIIKSNLPAIAKIDHPNLHTYSLSDSKSDFHAENIQIKDGSYHFNLKSKVENIENLILNIGGRHNVENSIAAVAAAQFLGIEKEMIKKALASFKGVKRRFEYQIKANEFVFIDDYAHHPEEIKAFINSVRELYPGKKITAIFQPHLYSRTKDFAPGFIESLNLADEVILLPIYPAREEPIEGVSSEMIYENLDVPEKFLYSKEELLQKIKEHHPEVLLTIGAGDIDQLVKPLKNIFMQ